MEQRILCEEVSELKSSKFWNALQEVRGKLVGDLLAMLFHSSDAKPLVHNDCFAQIVASRQGEINGINLFFQVLDTMEESYKKKAGT